MSDIYVDEHVGTPGNGTSWLDAYEALTPAVDQANGETGGSTIHVAPGTYLEYGLKILRENVTIRGRDPALNYDALGLPTGTVASVARWKLRSDLPVGTKETLLTVTKSNFEISGIVLEGINPRPPGVGDALLDIDGVAGAPTSLVNIKIHGNAFQEAKQGISLKLANATIEGNFIARNAVGLQSLGGFAGPGLQEVVFNRNRVIDNRNIGAAFGGHLGFTSPSGPGATEVKVTNNDFTGNGDARDPMPGPNGTTVYHSQNIQYTALLFVPMNGDVSKFSDDARIEATITNNTFWKNGYGVAVALRLRTNMLQLGQYLFNATLEENTYCSNGLNNLCADFSLITATHGATISGLPMRCSTNARYTIDATGDALTMEDDVDYNHPAIDPKFPGVPLDNQFIFNGDPVAPSVEITMPANSIPIPIVDKDPPRIRSATAVPVVLWPAIGQMVLVSIAIDARDGCDPRPHFEIVGVTSNEPIEGPTSPDPDYRIVGPLSLWLRSERAGNNTSRIYTVTVRCTDHDGNSSIKAVSVIVPAPLKRLWLGMLTRGSHSAGSNKPVVLIVNEDGVDKVHETILNTPQADRERGQACLYELDVSSENIIPENLSDSSIRVAIRGVDPWEPEHVVVWGERGDGSIVPIAIERDLKARSNGVSLRVSTDLDDGDESFPVRLVSGDSQRDGILVLMTTADVRAVGAANPSVELELRENGSPVLNHILQAPPQDGQKKGGANLYFIPVNAEFDSIRLKLQGNDDWLPGSFFLFETRSGERTLKSRVHMAPWGRGWMSAGQQIVL